MAIVATKLKIEETAYQIDTLEFPKRFKSMKE